MKLLVLGSFILLAFLAIGSLGFEDGGDEDTVIINGN